MIKDIDLSIIELVVFDFDGVFTNNFVYVDEHGVEQVRCNRSDGLGLKKLKEININSYIVSTETNNVVQARAKKLGISCLNAIEDKGSAVKDLVKSLNIDLGRVMFVGNDINDIPAFKAVGFPVGVADSYNDIDEYILFKTIRLGGCGAVREICDMIYSQYIKSGKLNV
tara:strand:- start:15072 stop:15578 length:507 start_codon:yes stop_codon:yes gene_type:complete